MNENTIQNLKRFFAVIVGLVLMFASVTFSNEGFAFNIQNEHVGWIGMAMALSITAIELVFNGQLSYRQSNYTLYILGIAAYMYGVFSNVIGVWRFQGITMATFSDLTFGSAFGLFLGLFLEIAPEPLIIYGLIGISDTEGDMIGALFKTFSGGSKSNSKFSAPSTFTHNSVNRPDNKPRKPTKLASPMSFSPTNTPGEYVRDNEDWETSVAEFRNIMKDQ